MKKHFHIHIGGHKSSRAGVFSKIGKDPFIDWFVILIVSTLATILFVAFSISLFFSIENSSDLASTGPGAPAVGGSLDKPDLEKLVTNFHQKQSMTAMFQRGYQGPSDPSFLSASAAAASSASSSPSSTAASKPAAGAKVVGVK